MLTDEDYIQFVLRMRDEDNIHPFPFTARYYLRKYPTPFIGYSLLDYNLRLFLKTLRLQLQAPCPWGRFALTGAEPLRKKSIDTFWSGAGVYTSRQVCQPRHPPLTCFPLRKTRGFARNRGALRKRVDA